MIRLVVNGDDLGLHPKIDAGIFKARTEGILTSATLIATGRTGPEAVERARALGIGIGVHLTLCTGVPPALDVSRVRSLAPTGVFRASWIDVAKAFALGQIRLDEVEAEFREQITRARSLGAQVDHLDGHQHLHLLPAIASIVRRIADELGVAIRRPYELPRAAWLSRPGPAAKSLILSGLALQLPRTGPTAIGLFDSGALDEQRVLEIVSTLRDGDYELACHPGEDPSHVPEDPSWRYGWSTELAALCSERVRARIDERGIALRTYAAVASNNT